MVRSKAKRKTFRATLQRNVWVRPEPRFRGDDVGSDWQSWKDDYNTEEHRKEEVFILETSEKKAYKKAKDYFIKRAPIILPNWVHTYINMNVKEKRERLRKYLDESEKNFEKGEYRIVIEEINYFPAIP